MPNGVETGPRSSPLEPIFAHADAHSIPLAFREQFLHSAAYPYGMALQGHMESVWYRPRWLAPLFKLLGRMGILVPRIGRNVPVTLEVLPGFTSSGVPFHQWNRTLSFEEPVYFDTTIVWDEKLGKVADLVGPRGILYMVWKAEFHPPRRFTLDTDACAFRLRNRLFWLPRWLSRLLLGEVRFVQEAEINHEDTVHIDLLVTHPLFGAIFGYTGTLRTIRTERRLASTDGDARGIRPEYPA